MIAGRWFITPHAVRRYQQRVERVPYHVALARLIDWSQDASKVRDLDDERELWRGPKPQRRRLVVGRSRAGAPQLLTVWRY
jgi:hypothetical protein